MQIYVKKDKEITEIKINKLHNKIFVIIGALSIIYYIGLVIFNVSFSVFWLGLGVILILLGFINFNNVKNNNFFKCVKLIFLLGMLSFVIIESGIIYSSFKKDKVNCKNIIILGAGLRGDKMSLTLYQRMNSSLDYINSHKDSNVILSGGKGKDERIPESEAMKKFLIQKGVKEDRIIKEEKSINTFQNFKYSKKILKKLGNDNKELMIVTSDFHMFRAKFIARRIGFKAYGNPARSHPLLLPNYYVREYFGFIKTFLFDK